MAKYYEKKEFLDERDQWYSLLKEEGFDDIEILDGNTRQPGPMLRGVSPGDLRRSLYKPETEDYYRCARSHVWRVRRGLRRDVWRLHADGYGEVSVFKALDGHYPGLTSHKVKKIIKEEKAAMMRVWDRQAEADFLDQ
jgi:hypothetical protein